jgi:hypothetical protein
MIRTPNIQSALRDQADNNVFNLVGTRAPTDGITGAGIAGPGSTYLNLSVYAIHLNIGSLASPKWVNVIGQLGLLHKTGRILSSDIIGTNEGQLGHPLGVPLIPAQYANPPAYTVPNIIFPSYVFLKYYRITADFEDGSDLEIGWEDSLAVTGSISPSNFLGANSDKRIVLLPIVPTNNEVIAEKSINLRITGSPYTNDEAEGFIDWQISYLTTFS